MQKKQIVGYTAGAFDLFHIGHLNLLKNAKGMCDKLVVGVSVDELLAYKNTKPTIPFEERLEIVRSIKYVDVAIPQYSLDKVEMCKKIKADYLFVGDDWYENERWKKYEADLKEIDVKVIYFPYTRSVSSTKIRKELAKNK